MPTHQTLPEALKEAGKVKSDREAARKIAADTGETDEGVRHKIRTGKKDDFT